MNELNKKYPMSAAAGGAPSNAAESPAEEMIPVNGFAQVVAILQHADPEFRDSLLRRIAIRDKKLAHSLREELDLI